MGKVLLSDGYRITINTNDHEPAHVHVWKNGGVIVVYLNGENGDEDEVLWVREHRDLKAQEIRKALELVRENHALCMEKWEEIHG